jgi:hypothetical protein
LYTYALCEKHVLEVLGPIRDGALEEPVDWNGIATPMPAFLPLGHVLTVTPDAAGAADVAVIPPNVDGDGKWILLRVRRTTPPDAAARRRWWDALPWTTHRRLLVEVLTPDNQRYDDVNDINGVDHRKAGAVLIVRNGSMKPYVLSLDAAAAADDDGQHRALWNLAMAMDLHVRGARLCEGLVTGVLPQADPVHVYLDNPVDATDLPKLAGQLWPTLKQTHVHANGADAAWTMELLVDGGSYTGPPWVFRELARAWWGRWDFAPLLSEYPSEPDYPTVCASVGVSVWWYGSDDCNRAPSPNTFHTLTVVTIDC